MSIILPIGVAVAVEVTLLVGVGNHVPALGHTIVGIIEIVAYVSMFLAVVVEQNGNGVFVEFEVAGVVQVKVLAGTEVLGIPELLALCVFAGLGQMC